MSDIQCIATPAMELQRSSKLYLRCVFFLRKPLHRAFSRTPSTPHTRALPTAPHWVQTHPSCKPCTRVSAARPYLWSGQGDPGKTAAIQQRGKAAVSRNENFWDSFVHSCEAPREQKKHLGGGEAAAHQENCWQQADFQEHLEKG